MARQQLREISLSRLSTKSSKLEQVRASIDNGVLPVLIHPFYEAYLEKPTARTAKNHVLKSLNQIKGHQVDARLLKRRLLSGGEITSLTEEGFLLRLWHFLRTTKFGYLLLGEHSPFVSASIDLLRKFGYSGSLLYYETAEGDPAPAGEIADWSQLAQIIKQLGPSSLVVGGQLARFNRDDTQAVCGCVPGFVRKLSEVYPDAGTRFIISPIVYPNWWLENDHDPYFMALNHTTRLNR